MMNYMTRYDMNSNQKLERSKQAVPLRRTTSFLTANHRFAYGKLLRTLLILVMITLGAHGAWGQGPVEITTDTNGNGTIEDSEKKFYLIQTNAFPSFFIAPQADNTITTNNILGEYMLWYFLDADTDGDTQYYYIVNNSTGKYIYNYNGNSRGINITDFASLSDANKEKCKFKIVENNTNGAGYYNINVKANQSYYGLNKQNGSMTNNNNPIRLTDTQYINNINSLWKFIPYESFTWPTPPFTPSNASETYYYQIHNVQKDTYYAATDATTDKVIFTNQANESRAWYFKEASSDSWYKYYYIINPATGGKYMYYNGTADNTSNQTNAISVKAYDSNDEDRYQFVVVQAARGDGDNRVECYAIIPRLLIDNLWTSSSIGYAQASITNGLNMGIINSRGQNNGAHWEFFEVQQVEKPVIQYDATQNGIVITSATEGATVYYTTAANEASLAVPTPSTGTACNSGELLQDGVSNKFIKAIAIKDGYMTSEVSDLFSPVTLKCAKPIIKKNNDGTYTISCAVPSSGVTIYYTTDGSNPTTGSTSCATGYTTNFSVGTTVKAMAVATDYYNSDVVTKKILSGFPSGAGDGTAANPYEISTSDLFDVFVDEVNGDGQNGVYYKVTEDIDVSGCAEITTAFQGNLDGNYHKLSGFDHTMFNSINGGTVKNVILDNVSITSGTNVGAICNEATGASRIYNCGVLATSSTVETDGDGYTKITSCSSSISGSGYVGGIVGLLDGSSRVINCFSYANITGGDLVGGIVGRNNVATTSAADNLKTMVMNCMFYGNITGGTNKAPIYNGQIISNVGNNGVGNYNYFLADATFTGGIDTYNCALMAEKSFLQRFEFFRQLLNSHLELAGWWATGTFSKAEMAKWVLEPSQLGTSTPYPILKAQGKYPSVVNYDAENATTQAERNKGGKLGTLTVNIRMGSGGAVYGPPTGAAITTSSLTLNITDKDPDHFNFNYYKVQLPYYNDVGTKNYNGNRVVTGWKIVSISGGTSGSFTTGNDATANANGEITAAPYNFADRHCTNKDLYSVSGRVFNQGAYWDVPEGVTAITIEPYWAKCVYLADANADVVYNLEMKTAYPVPNVGGGGIYTNGNSYSIAGENQMVYTTMGDAISSSNSTGLFVGIEGDANNQTVYDYAVVLVGNYHNYNSIESSNSKPYTVTSIDLDGDNEPDYSYILRFDARKGVHPVKVDFLNVPGLGMAQKSTDSSGSYNFGIMQPQSWFEVTNTALFRVTQFEYEHKDRVAMPLILHGGVIEQWVSGQSGGNGKKTTYIHVGSNVWFKEFHLGCHQDATLSTAHPPVSVTGGDYNEFYLTGLYSNAGNNEDNAECYINGGRFDKVAGTGIEGIGNASTHAKGNIVWQIQNADIEEFYGGGINANKPIEGSITTVITSSHVKRFCGGPKFGDMNPNRTVITTATDCTFGSFFGAGYGGNSYNRAAPGNFTSQTNYQWNNWVAGTVRGNVAPTNSTAGNYPGGITYEGYKQDYISAFGGVSTRFDYQFLPQSDNVNNVARLFIDFVKFSLATTRNVTSTLTGCTIMGNFYGGGSLGKVDGNVTSTLTDCTVRGSVFGGGYDATQPTVQVMNTSETGSIDGFLTPPRYDTNTGTFFPAAEPYNTSTEYTWEHSSTVNSTETAIDKTNHILYTTADLTTLGQVTGNVTLNILGNTLVEGLAVDYEGNPTNGNRGGVFGGGDASAVLGNTTVIINATDLQEGATYNAYCVYGGGNIAPVGGNTTVNIQGNTYVHGNVFGGGNEGEVSGNTRVNIRAAEPANP